MSPDEQIRHLLTDFRRFVNDGVATVHLAHAGLGALAQRITTLASPVPENPDPTMFIGRGDPNDSESRSFARWRLSELVAQGEQGSPAFVRLAQQWVTSTFSRWEEVVRPGIGAVVGITERAELRRITCPVLGDLRNWRNDIVHHDGVATTGNTGKNTILTRFGNGDVIAPTGEDHVTFVDALDGGVTILAPDE